jgi:hypothetical protein
MQATVRDFARVVLIATITAGCGVAQDGASEKHVAEIIAESKAKHPEGESESVLCREARAERPPYSHYHFRELNQGTLEKDLPSLFQKSDEVVLVGVILREVAALSPSDQDAVMYQDARVLRSWKGSHQLGDVLTFAIPNASIRCGMEKNEISGTVTAPGPPTQWSLSWNYGLQGPYLLFLRRDNTGLADGLLPAGGEGMQGVFIVDPTRDLTDIHSELFDCFRASLDRAMCTENNYAKRYPGFPGCTDAHIDAADISSCNALLSKSQKPIAIGLIRDPLREKYDGMPVSRFLRDVQSAADSASNAGQTESSR